MAGGDTHPVIAPASGAGPKVALAGPLERAADLPERLRSAGAEVLPDSSERTRGRELREVLREAERGPAPDAVVVVLDGQWRAAVDEIARERSRAPGVGFVTLASRDDEVDPDAVRRGGTDDHVVLEEAEPGRLAAALDRATLRARVRALEAELSVRDERFRNTVERMADGIVVVDEEGTILFCNPAAESLFGRPASELVGAAFGLPTVIGETTEVEIHTRGGPARVAELRVVDTVWDQFPALLVSLRDITDRKEAEERRRRLAREQAARSEAESAARRAELLAEVSRRLGESLELPAVLQGTADFVVEKVADHCVIDITDPEWRRDVRCVVRSAERSEEAGELGSWDGPCSALVDEVVESHAARVEDALDEETLDRIAPEAHQRNLLRALDVRAMVVVPLATPSATFGALSVLSSDDRRRFDAAERALVEELARRTALALENARLYQKALRANRAKDDFLTVMSHELRTPLTAVTGYAGLLEEGVSGSLDEAHREYVVGIQRNAERLLRIIDQILLFARSEADEEEVEYDEVDVAELVDDVVSLARPMTEREDLTLEVSVPEGLTVITDPRLVRQILLHLLTNAVKFTEEGGVHVEASAGEDGMILRVSDTGIGIPDERLDDIFEPFSQVEAPRTRAVGGTGLGLNVVRNLTDLLGGRLDVESRRGEGSTFTVTLPVKGEMPEEA